VVSYERSLIPFARRNNIFCVCKLYLHLLEELERALLGDIAHLTQPRDGLLARRVLLLADDAARLRLHQVALLQAAGRVPRRAVEHLRLAADRSNLAAVLVAIVIVVAAAILTSNV